MESTTQKKHVLYPHRILWLRALESFKESKQGEGDYRKRLQAIIMLAAASEAYVNFIGYCIAGEDFRKNRDEDGPPERFSIKKKKLKWIRDTINKKREALPKPQKEATTQFEIDFGSPDFQTFKKLHEIRDQWMHPKIKPVISAENISTEHAFMKNFAEFDEQEVAGFFCSVEKLCNRLKEAAINCHYNKQADEALTSFTIDSGSVFKSTFLPTPSTPLNS